MDEFLGRVVNGYLLEEFVGKGGHGAVFRAVDQQSGQVVAVKVVLPEYAQDEKLLQRLHIEAEIIRDLRHPNIVRLRDTWEDNHGVWIAMRWLGGGNLREYLQRHGAMPPEDAVPILAQIGSALDAAHAAQIIHRDLKPDNIMLDDEGNAYLTDFGIAKRIGYTAITSMGVVVGSPNYLSPEQIMGYELSPRTDIYALGILLYELLSGSHPFMAVTSRIQMMMMMVQNPLPPVTTIPGDLGEEINKLIQRATSKNAQERYPAASSLARHYEELVQEHSLDAE